MDKIDKDALRKFAQERVYWYGKERPAIDLNDVLQTILAVQTPGVEAEARTKFNLTDKDFREALKTTPPGMFRGPGSEQKWEKVNLRLGIVPPLPFPRRDLEKDWAELRRYQELDRKKSQSGVQPLR